LLALLASVGAAHAATTPSGGCATTTPTTTTPTTATPTTTTPTTTGTSTTGGAGLAAPPSGVSTPVHPIVQGDVAKVIHGLAYAPSCAPIQVQRLIWAGDAIRTKPYLYGGGHGVWNDIGYDCSGSVSYVLHAAGLLKTSMDSSEFETWGVASAGTWITVYTNPGHAFIEVAGIRLDTSAEQDPHPAPGTGPRWRPLMTSTRDYQARHPLDF
jgi:cell wall-associated NlpC family hydrolase